MSAQPNGLDDLESRFQRRPRTVPPPRRPRAAPPDVAELPQQAQPPQSSAVPKPVVQPRARSHLPRAITRSHVDAGPHDPTAQLFVRVRKPLDNHLAELVSVLRRDGVKTSKLELIEMLLWELPMEADAEFRRRLGAFRRAAPREEQP